MKVSNRTIIISITIISVLVVSLLGFVAVVFLSTPNILDVTSENNTYQSQISKYNSSRIDDTITVFDSVSSSTNSNKKKNNNSSSNTILSKIEDHSSELSANSSTNTHSSQSSVPSVQVPPVPDDKNSVEELNRSLFQQLYNLNETEYLLSISKQLSSLNKELNEFKQKASDNYVKYQRDKESLKEKFANMGMLNSGAYKGALENLETNYKNTRDEYSEKIESLEDKIATLTEEQNNPNPNNILEQLAYNNNMTFEEAVEKYNKYILS